MGMLSVAASIGKSPRGVKVKVPSKVYGETHEATEKKLRAQSGFTYDNLYRIKVLFS
jgi:hypothetical protein